MIDVFYSLLEFKTASSVAIGLSLLFLSAIVLAPPSEHICVAFGLWLSRGPSKVWILFILPLIYCIGTCIWYLLGRLNNRNNEKTFIKNSIKKFMAKGLSISTDLWPKIVLLFAPNDSKAIVRLIILRNVPVIHSIVSYPAGRGSMSFRNFLFSSYIGIFIWTTVWTISGLFFYKYIEKYMLAFTFGYGLIALLLLVSTNFIELPNKSNSADAKTRG